MTKAKKSTLTGIGIKDLKLLTYITMSLKVACPRDVFLSEAKVLGFLVDTFLDDVPWMT